MALILIAHNDGTGTDIEGNYNVRVQVNDRVLWQGRIEGFLRPAGWAALLKRCVKLLPREDK